MAMVVIKGFFVWTPLTGEQVYMRFKKDVVKQEVRVFQSM